MEKAIDEKIKWLDENQDADSEAFQQQKKELEEVVKPIITKLYQGGAPPPGSPTEDDLKDEL